MVGVAGEDEDNFSQILFFQYGIEGWRNWAVRLSRVLLSMRTLPAIGGRAIRVTGI